MPKGKFAVTIVVLLLIGAPLLGEYLSNRPVRRERANVIRRTSVNQQSDSLACFSTTRCKADLDGDGIAGSIEVVPLGDSFYPNNRGLLVIEGNKELLWLPFRHSDAEAPARIAVIEDSYGTRLLVSDASCPDLHEAAFEWNGEQLVKLKPTEAELSALSSARDSEDYSNAGRYVKGDGSGDEVMPSFSDVKLFFYYAVLVILGAVLLYRRSLRLSAAPSLFAKGKP